MNHVLPEEGCGVVTDVIIVQNFGAKGPVILRKISANGIEVPCCFVKVSSALFGFYFIINHVT